MPGVIHVRLEMSLPVSHLFLEPWQRSQLSVELYADDERVYTPSHSFQSGNYSDYEALHEMGLSRYEEENAWPTVEDWLNDPEFADQHGVYEENQSPPPREEENEQLSAPSSHHRRVGSWIID